MTSILFVEDESWGVDAYIPRLSTHGFHCAIAHDYEEAVRKLAAERFDIVSLDIMFSRGEVLALEDTGELKPQSIGLKLLQAIRNKRIPNCDPDTKTVVLTASANGDIARQVRGLGISAYLTKPVAFEKVIDTFLKLKE
jgi:CheY-like chemotaxis protein